MMRGAVLGLLAASCMLGLSGPPAQAERLVTSVSTHRVMVTANFTGTIPLFAENTLLPSAWIGRCTSPR